MNDTIFKQALTKLEELLKKYDGFITIFLDDWRGYRFIYDIKPSNCCKDSCKKCPIYRLLKDEKEINGFTAGLYLASSKEKKLFGPQEFLNCKSFDEYQNCYVNFLLEKCNTKQEIFDELNLVKNMKVIYSKKDSPEKQEIKFKKGVIQKALASSETKKTKNIREYLNLNPDFYKIAQNNSK